MTETRIMICSIGFILGIVILFYSLYKIYQIKKEMDYHEKQLEKCYKMLLGEEDELS